MKATEAQVEAWKREHKCSIFEYTANKDSEDEKRGYFRAMTPMELDAYTSMVKQSQLKADMMVINSCWLDGDEEVIKDDAYVLGLRDWLGALVVKIEGEMVEL